MARFCGGSPAIPWAVKRERLRGGRTGVSHRGLLIDPAGEKCRASLHYDLGEKFNSLIFKRCFSWHKICIIFSDINVIDTERMSNQMKKITVQLSVALVAACFSLPSAATYITYNSVLDADGVSTTAVAGATVVDFNDYSCGAYVSCTGNGLLAVGDLPGRYAAPHISATALDDTTVYLTVPSTDRSGSVDLGLGTTANYFGLLWGSIDNYNTLSFLSGGSVVASFTGADITNPANGHQTAPSTNTYVNFFQLPTFDSVRVISTNYAFESDNHAWATLPVPEPSALGLLGLGLLGVGLIKRKRPA